jgi:hypothetical protein
LRGEGEIRREVVGVEGCMTRLPNIPSIILNFSANKAGN